jgi:FkbM family methyltransferase
VVQLLSDLTRKLHFWARFLEDPCVRRARSLGIDVETYARFRRPWLTQAGIQSVIDVGANIGQFARMIHDALPAAKIYAFEPLPDCFESLVRQMAGVSTFKAYNVALGSTEGTHTFHRNPFSLSSSFRVMTDLHHRNFPQTAGGDVSMAIPIRTLDSFASELDLPDKLLIKLDVQGYEDEVLRGGAGLIPRAHVVIVEASFQPLYEAQASFHELYARLTGWGFEFKGFVDHLYSSVDGGPLQGDGLFVKGTHLPAI